MKNHVLFAAALTFSFVVATFFPATPAQADELNSYVTVNCDTARKVAMVRFAHQDDDDDPVFLPIPGSPANDLSRIPTSISGKADVMHNHTQEASCQLPGGIEVKVRYADGGEDVGWAYSVWFDKKEIISKVRGILKPRSVLGLAHSWLIDGHSVRECSFRLKENDDEYQLRAEMITCTRPMPAVGHPDPIEYPSGPGTAQPLEGSMKILNAVDPELCGKLVFDEPKGNDYSNFPTRDIYNRAPLGSQVVSLRNAGMARAPGGKAIFGDIGAPSVDLETYDFFNEGHPQNVYRMYASSHAFDGDNFIVTEPSTPIETIATSIQKLFSGDPAYNSLQTIASRIGARVIDFGPETHIEVFAYRGKTYILSTPDGGDPAAELFEPQPTGNLKKLCTFQPIFAHL